MVDKEKERLIKENKALQRNYEQVKRENKRLRSIVNSHFKLAKEWAEDRLEETNENLQG